jgi:hypothetical protein
VSFVKKKERRMHNLPLCRCGNMPTLRGSYCTESCGRVWYYQIACGSERCDTTIRLFGDVYTQADALTTWRRHLQEITS